MGTIPYLSPEAVQGKHPAAGFDLWGLTLSLYEAVAGRNPFLGSEGLETLKRIGKQAGLSQQDVESCMKDQTLLDKIAADQKYASDVLKVDSTPTFFINGEKIKGEQSFEEFAKRINAALKT